MPIRPENRARYPANWPQISLERREAAGWRCESCKVRHGSWGWRDAAGRFHRVNKRAVRQEGRRFYVQQLDGVRIKVIEIVLTVAHLDHTPENCAAENLRAWCQRCHNLYDAPMRRAGMRERARDPDQIDLFTPPEDTP